MTGSNNGIVSLWKNKKIEKSTKSLDELTLVLFKDGCIFAASGNKKTIELNMNLEVVRKFRGQNEWPITIDANENYLVVGYPWPGYVDVHNRKELDQDGTHQKKIVSNIYSIDYTLFIIGVPASSRGIPCHYQK